MRYYPCLIVVALLTACDRGIPARSVPGQPDAAAAIATPPERVDSSAAGRVVLSAEAERTAGVLTTLARREGAASTAGWLTVPGQIEADPARVSLISPRVGGRLERLDAVVGQRVVAGQAVAHLYSPAFMTAQGDYQLALQRADALGRTADSTGARALAGAARRRLLLAGATEDDVERLARGEPPRPLLAIRAPANGSLVEQGALAGSAVEPGTMLFRLVDLSEVDVVADVPERELQQLRLGQRATVTLAALPGVRYPGVVERIRDELDPTTRTIDAILHVRNPRGQLRPGMFATVELGVAAGTSALPDGARHEERSDVVVSIPESAVLMDGARRIVFVQVAPHTFERRAVDIMPLGSQEDVAPVDRRVLVTSGLQAGEAVVTTGAFTLKSEIAKAAFAEDE